MSSKIITDNFKTEGNFQVDGELTSIESTTVTTADNLIIINKGEVGSGVTNTYSGLDVDRGLLTNYRFTFMVTKENIIFRNIGSHAIIDKGQA